LTTVRHRITATKAIAPRIMVSKAWQDAHVTDVAHATDVTTDIKAGMQVCHNSAITIRDVASGYRCGAKAAEAWGEGGYPAGNDGTGCFVTAHGCVKS
jgi:hypothetical protein